MRGRFLIAFYLIIIVLGVNSFISTSMAADVSPKVSVVPESSSADNLSWKEYQKLLENYYFLDKQKAGHISCHVFDPQLQDYIDTIRQKLGSKLTIDENLSDFSVTYDRTKGVSFNSPHLKLNFTPDAKTSDTEGAEKQRKVMEMGFGNEISKTEGIIAGYLDDLIFPSPEKVKNLSLIKNGDTAVVSYDQESLYDHKNEHHRIIYSGTTQKESESSSTSNSTFISDYQPLNGKLVLAHQVSEITYGSRKISGVESISYQDLGSVFFPALVLADVTQSKDALQPKQGHVEINFKDCKTSDVSQ